ncbi:hypothetical protein Hanom_Chr05g00420021 [Helianthus anomalus]
MPITYITDHMIFKNIKPLPNLIVLDVSHYLKITRKGLAAFGNDCESLLQLKRNMPPLDAGLLPVVDS